MSKSSEHWAGRQEIEQELSIAHMGVEHKLTAKFTKDMQIGVAIGMATIVVAGILLFGCYKAILG